MSSEFSAETDFEIFLDMSDIFEHVLNQFLKHMEAVIIE